jgi:hypothetical protein
MNILREIYIRTRHVVLLKVSSKSRVFIRLIRIRLIDAGTGLYRGNSRRPVREPVAEVVLCVR